MSAEDELDRIKEKYSRLKQANKVLKEGLLEKNEACDRLEAQIKDKETLLKQQLEEIDHLQFQNGRVSKQLGTVTAQLDEAKQRQSAGGGWSVGNLITGKQQQEALQRATEEIRALQDELQMKIEENEGLHMQIFECNREHEITEQQLQESVTSLTQELETKTKDLETEQERTASLTKQVKSFTAQVSKLESNALEAEASINELKATLQRERDVAIEKISSLETELKRIRPFDERRHRLWLEWEVTTASGRAVGSREKVVSQLKNPLSEMCRQSAEVLRVWTQTFGGVAGGKEDSATQQVRRKLSTSLEELVKQLGDSVPQLFNSTDLLDLNPSAALVEGLKVQSAALLTMHRKWVMYQSMLLLHEHQRSATSQTQQDAAQTLRFVDCLWRLHRRLRAFFVRLRTLPCVLGMGTSSRSASHFQLARNAMSARDFRSSLCAADALPRFCGAVRSTLHELLQCWEGIGRTLSAWSMAKVTLDSSSRGAFGDLLEVVHRFSGAFTDTLLPAVDRWKRLAEEDAQGLLEDEHPSSARSFGAFRSWQPLSSKRGYVGQLNQSLTHAPPAFGYATAVLTRAAAQKLEATGSRLSAEVRQQVKRLQVVTDEKTALMEEFRTLQDEHALLRSNLQATQGASTARSVSPTISSQAPTPVSAPSGLRHGTSSDWQLAQNPATFLTASRQRAMLEALSISSQESSIQQHGYFVDVLNLTSADVSYSSSGPSGHPTGMIAGEVSSVESATSSWELAVRRVYEQHTRLLQAQVQAAEGKALELHIAVRDNLDRLKAEEAAKQSLRDEKERVRLQLQRKDEELESTRKNYETQLAVLTEHLCDLSSSSGSASALTSSQKVLCGRCGTWNHLTKLLGNAKNNAGTCMSCKEKVLSL